jgi:autotransporter-associated beta strand protein
MRALITSFLLSILPGLAAPVVLGPLQNPNNFNRTTFSTAGIVNGTQGFINYGINLNSQTYNVHLPANYTPSGTYGLITYIDAGDSGTMPSVYQSALDEHGLIFLAGTGIGNSVARSTRAGVAVMGSYRMCELHQIDRSRIYLMGNSGGGRLGMDVVYARPDWFGGFIGLSGASFGGYIPNWEPPGRLQDSIVDNDYWPNNPEYYEVSQMISYGSTAYRTPPAPVKVAFQAFHDDFRRTELVGTYRYAFMNHGAAVRLVYRNGGHSASNASAFDETLRFMQHPYATVIRDRFEDANLATNTDPANTLERGSGFLNRSFAGGSATEANYSYNSKTQKVLRLTPGGGTAAVEAGNRFNWFNPHGIILDVKLRAETQAGDNQQIGIHIARGDSDDTPEDNPGLHVFRNHGGKNRLILVKADGSSVELARWDYSGTHPMAMATGDKLFWDSTAAPEHAGKTRDFRGEDLRVTADNKGLQLTFSRTVTGLETTFASGVILGSTARTVTSTTSSYYNQSDQEEHPILLQFLWDDMGLRADVEALAFRHWKLLLSNRAFNPALAAGDALVDELTLIAPAEETNFIPPTITTPGDLTVNAGSGQGAIVPFTVTATDQSGAALTTTCVPPSGTGFPIGSTTVSCTTSDSNGNTATATFNVIVLANGFTPAPPSAPLPPSISPGLTAATLAWQTQSFATSYSVKRSSSPAGPFTTVATGLTSTTFTDTGLVHNVPAYYILTASNNAGESAPSTVASITTTPGTATKADNAAALDTLASWSANQLPGGPDIALWDATVTTSNNVSVGDGTSLGGIRITHPGGNVAISSGGAETLTLGASGIDLTGSVRSLTLTAPVVLAADQTWTSGNFGASGDVQILADSAISGPGKLTCAQSAGRSLSLTRANSFTGGFTLGAGATVTVGASAVVASGNTTSSAFGTYNGGQTLSIEGGVIDHAGFGFHAKNVRVTGDFKFINNARINFGGSFDMAGGTRTMTLVRSASNANTLVAGGNATLNVSSGGAFAVSNGTLRIAADASVPAGNFVVLTPQGGTAFTNNAGLVLGDKVYYGKAGTGTLNGATTVPAVTLEAGSVWDLSDGGNARNPQVNSLAGAGSVVNTWSSGGSGALHTLTIKGNSNNGRSDFSGRIFDDGGTVFPTRTAGQTAVVKDGSTTQVFSGANDYSGTTSVNGGTLLVNGSVASPANLTVAATATLGGSGSIASPVIVNGTLAPGDGPGTLTLTGSLAMNATGKLQWQLGGNATTGGDFLNAAAVTVSSGAKLDLVFNAPGSTVSLADPFWQSNRSWPVLSSAALSGSFALGTISTDATGAATTGFGTFGLTHAGNAVTLHWTAYSARERWNHLHFGSLASTGNAADTSDPNLDGETNLLEFATAQSPHAATRATTTLTPSGNDFLFHYTRSKAAASEGYSFTVEWSDTLAPPWTSAVSDPPVSLDTTRESVTTPIPAGPNGRRFVHVRIGTP